MTKDWNPGHDLIKGYPYDGIKTKELFPNRLQADIGVNGKPWFTVDKEIFKDCPEYNQVLTEGESFILARVIDFKKALEIAEDQIFSLLEERPFVPEEMNFELLAKSEKPSDPPYRIYGPKHDPNFSIYRKPGNIDDKSWDPSIWTLTMNKDGIMKDVEVKLPCRRIAYAVFTAFGIQLTELEKEGSQAPVKEEAPVE